MYYDAKVSTALQKKDRKTILLLKISSKVMACHDVRDGAPIFIYVYKTQTHAYQTQLGRAEKVVRVGTRKIDFLG